MTRANLTAHPPPAAAPARHRASSTLQIWISESETAEWSDPSFQVPFLRATAQRTREKGRKFFEVYAASGVRLYAGAV